MGSKQTKTTLHIYTRVSTVVQETDGTSLDTQQELGIKKAKELGFKPKVWNEGAASSHHEDLVNRPVLSQLLGEIENGVIKHLFVKLSPRSFIEKPLPKLAAETKRPQQPKRFNGSSPKSGCE